MCKSWTSKIKREKNIYHKVKDLKRSRITKYDIIKNKHVTPIDIKAILIKNETKQVNDKAKPKYAAYEDTFILILGNYQNHGRL